MSEWIHSGSSEGALVGEMQDSPCIAYAAWPYGCRLNARCLAPHPQPVAQAILAFCQVLLTYQANGRIVMFT
jgi:hypothetical protein